MAKKKKATIEEAAALIEKSNIETLKEVLKPAAEETVSPYQVLDRSGILPCESTPEESRLVNEPVAITEIKPLSEKVLISLYEKHNVPRDFNASHPRWNVPSMKNRYALLLADIAVHEKL